MGIVSCFVNLREGCYKGHCSVKKGSKAGIADRKVVVGGGTIRVRKKRGSDTKINLVMICVLLYNCVYYKDYNR